MIDTSGITTWFNDLSASITTVDYFGLAGAAMATVFIAMLMLSFVRGRLSIWHALTIGTAAGFGASIIQSYTELIDWVILGLTGVSTAAMLFVAGMGAMILVMIWNIVRTRGKTAVR